MITEIDKKELIDLVIKHYDLIKKDYGTHFNHALDFFCNEYIFEVLNAKSFVTTTFSDKIKINYK